MTAGNDNTFVLSEKGYLYGCGGNSYDQLW
ncbi:MAG: RCC1-like domain-containing protein [Flavobacteriales bacterium AspAUS03]